MKRILTAFAVLAASLVSSAQTIYLCKDGDYVTKNISQGMEIDLAQQYDSITFAKPQMAPVVNITFNGSSASVKAPSWLEGVKTSVNGADVVVTSENVTDEVTYIVSGTSSNGSLTINGSYKLTIEMAGLDLTSSKGAALDIQCGKRTEIILREGTTNSLADATAGEQKAALYCKGHLEVSGAGTLNVTGNKSHAISTKEYMQVKRTTGTINIVKSANDAMHIGQYFQMNGGTVNITSTTTNDGIQVEATKDAADEQNGQMIIKGGTLNITMANQDAKALKADGDIAISGGTFTINANGNGSRGIQTNGNMVIGDEDSATSINITSRGSKCTLSECSDDPHKCYGMKIDGNLTINGGSTTVKNEGKAKNVKVGGTYKKNGGTADLVLE